MCYADCCLFYALDYISISTGNLYRVLHKKIPQRQLLWQAGKFYNRYRLDNFIIHVPAENMEVLNSPRIPIASVTLTRQLKQEEATTVKAPTATAATSAVAKPVAPAAKK